MNTELWPPLSVIRSAFQAGGAAPAVPDAPGPEAGTATVAMPGRHPRMRKAPWPRRRAPCSTCCFR